MPDNWQRPTEIAREADDQSREWSERKLEAEARTQIEAATFSAGAESSGENALEFAVHERPLVDQMQTVAETSCILPAAKTRRLIDWVRERMCPRLPPFRQDRPNGIGKIRWNNRRVLILTENRAGRKRYLIETLEQAIKVIDGLTSGARRNEIQRRFNADPTNEPADPLGDQLSPRGPELLGALHGPVPLRSAPESEAHRAVQRPHLLSSKGKRRRLQSVRLGICPDEV